MGFVETCQRLLKIHSYINFEFDLSESQKTKIAEVRERRILLRLEKLESRLNLSGSWQNDQLPCDVDDSGLVTSLDVLLLINEINRLPSIVLENSSRHDGSPYWDVNGDDSLSPLDVLMVVNTLNRSGDQTGITVNASPESDKNGNGVLVQSLVTIVGQVGANSRVMIRVQNQEGSTDFPPVITPVSGSFSQQVVLGNGANEIQIDARDELGRVTSRRLTLVKGDVVTDWNAAILNVIRDWTTVSNDPYNGRIVNSQPPLVARNLAMIHAAMFDAANGFDAQYQSYLNSGRAPEGASLLSAVAAAGYTVAKSLYNDLDELAVWQATLNESLALEEDANARRLGVEYGNVIGLQALADRQNDGSTRISNYAPGVSVGDWARTFPDFLPPLLPQWPNVTPFAIADVRAFRAPTPPTLSSEEYAFAVDQVMRFGALVGSERTDDHTEIALFWADGGGTATPPGHWNRIASSVLVESSESILESARTLALLNLAMADAGIASWDSKYAYDMWRPIDAIRKADLDENGITTKDENWLPLLKTPPFPTYTSGHSTFSGAAASVLTSLYGVSYAFESTSDAHTGYTQRPLGDELITRRQFSSFLQAAEEAGMSRIYGGIHFAFDNTEGLALGQSVGAFVVDNFLRPKEAE